MDAIRIAALCLFLAGQACAESSIVDPVAAGKFVGKVVTVEGVVAETKISQSGQLYLNFGNPYPKEVFTVLVLRDLRGFFPQAESLTGRKIRITGKVKDRKGHPCIILREAAQLSPLTVPAGPPPVRIKSD